MTNLDSVLKSKDVTLPTKVCMVKAMVFPVFVYGHGSWTIKKAEHWRIDAFKLWSWRRFMRVPWTLDLRLTKIKSVNLKGNQPWIFIGRTNAEAELQYLATFCEQPTQWRRPWCWERLKAKGEEGDRGWDASMASMMQWTKTWANSGRWWRTGKPIMLQSMGLWRVEYDLATEQQQDNKNKILSKKEK